MVIVSMGIAMIHNDCCNIAQCDERDAKNSFRCLG